MHTLVLILRELEQPTTSYEKSPRSRSSSSIQQEDEDLWVTSLTVLELWYINLFHS